MSTTIKLDNPTGAEQWIPDLGVMVANGETVEIENEEQAKGLLQNPIWKKPEKPAKTGEGA